MTRPEVEKQFGTCIVKSDREMELGNGVGIQPIKAFCFEPMGGPDSGGGDQWRCVPRFASFVNLCVYL